MDHTSSTPKSRLSSGASKRPRKLKTSERYPLTVDDDDSMDTEPALAPVGTAAASVLTQNTGEVTGTASTTGLQDQSKESMEALNKCKVVDEVVGPPISQQVCTVTVHVQPKRFPANYFTNEAEHKTRNSDALSENYYRCPPHCPVFTDSAIQPEDGVPRVMSHAQDGLAVGETFRFVGVTMEGKSGFAQPPPATCLC